MAENAAPQKTEPGLHYAKGLFYRYSNNPRNALQEFNQARNNGMWGDLAIVNMIEIYLNPDYSEAWDESPEKVDKVQSAMALLRVKT